MNDLVRFYRLNKDAWICRLKTPSFGFFWRFFSCALTRFNRWHRKSKKALISSDCRNPKDLAVKKKYWSNKDPSELAIYGLPIEKAASFGTSVDRPSFQVRSGESKVYCVPLNKLKQWHAKGFPIWIIFAVNLTFVFNKSLFTCEIQNNFFLVLAFTENSRYYNLSSKGRWARYATYIYDISKTRDHPRDLLFD